MPNLPEDLQESLARSFVIRTGMIRRKSGTPRVVETTYVWDGTDRIYLSGYPGKRDWVANMAANADVTVYTVEHEPHYEIQGKARVLRDRQERIPPLLSFIERWAKRPGVPRWQFQFFLATIKANRRLRLPWWGPFWFARKILDQMPCVEITLTGDPKKRPQGPPPLSEPRH